jgi:adenylosuccinate lyase
MRDIYQNPLITRYASREMAEIFSDDHKFRTWRKIWVTLSEVQRELGLNITLEQLNEMKLYQEQINYEIAEKREKEIRHDIMSHVHAFGAQCPNAKPIIHLGATSCDIGDNADIIIMVEGLEYLRKKLLNCIYYLTNFAQKYKNIATIGFTHFQPAQPTTVGKRACLWIQDLLLDLEELDTVLRTVRFRGLKGATGTQATFLTLFNGDHEKVKELDRRFSKKLGFDQVYPVTGQTYPRKLDTRILNVLSSISQSACKFSNDIRLLQNLKEIEEPFEEKQIGSSAMAYKRNPMRSERISSLARFVVINALNPAVTASTQWLERTLDDSANKRITIPQSFLAVDGILNLYINIVDGLVVHQKVIEKRLKEELPFMATEYILMEAVTKGGDRQDLHEKIRTYSMEAGKRVKVEGLDNNLIELILKDKDFALTAKEVEKIMEPRRFIGRAKEQVDEFIKNDVMPLLEQNQAILGYKAEINV